MSDVWVVNASPLIALARIQCLPLLADLSGAILIPERVLAEVEAGLSKDPAAAEILAWSAPFVRQLPDNNVPGLCDRRLYHNMVFG